jgi:hypothetical protein
MKRHTATTTNTNTERPLIARNAAFIGQHFLCGKFWNGFNLMSVIVPLQTNRYEFLGFAFWRFAPAQVPLLINRKG